MKKSILIAIALCCTVAVSMAQTKKLSVNKAVSNASAFVNELKPDTLNYMATYKDMAVRVSVMSQLSYIISSPGDVTPNQRQRVLIVADSLIKVDAALYKQNEANKKIKKP